MNRIALFIIIIFTAGRVKAQNEFRLLTLGVGAGAATTFAGTPVIKTTLAFNGNVCFYPAEFFDIALEGQIGQLAGGIPGTPHLNFNNKYQAIMLEPTLQLGALLNNSQSEFFKNFYVGAGYGYIHNRVTNITFGIPQYSRDIIPIVPVKFGYEINIVDDYNNPKLKINLSYSVNATIGRGIDGYYGDMPQATKFYVYYAIQIAYPINLIQNYGRGRLRFD